MVEAIDRDDFIRRGGFASYFPYVSFGFFFITIPFLSPQISLFGSMTVNETESAAIAFVALLASLVGAVLIAHFPMRIVRLRCGLPLDLWRRMRRAALYAVSRRCWERLVPSLPTLLTCCALFWRFLL